MDPVAWLAKTVAESAVGEFVSSLISGQEDEIPPAQQAAEFVDALPDELTSAAELSESLRERSKIEMEYRREVESITGSETEEKRIQYEQ